MSLIRLPTPHVINWYVPTTVIGLTDADIHAPDSHFSVEFPLHGLFITFITRKYALVNPKPCSMTADSAIALRSDKIYSEPFDFIAPRHRLLSF
jgi:hypothetical protein